MRGFRFASALVVLAALGACGGNGNAGGSGTGPGPTVSSLSISPATAMLRINGTETFTATATMSNGSTSAVTPAWRTGNASVAAIDANGRATAVAAGTTVITAEYQGASATRDLRVVPDYHGTWRGRMNVTTCTEDGDWRSSNFCRELGTGDVDSVGLVASQQDAAITGTLDLGGLAGAITGSVAGDGTLTVTGEYTATTGGFAFRIGIVEWQSVTADNGRMTGHLTFTIRNDQLTGLARVQADLLNMNKTSSSTLMPVRSAEGRVIAAARRVTWK